MLYLFIYFKNPDLDECVRQMQQLLQLELDQLMLIKQPAVIDTVRSVNSCYSWS